MDSSNIDNKYFCVNCKDQNYLIECTCGCGELIFRYDKSRKQRRFKPYHHSFGPNNYNWNNGIRYTRNYRYLLMPDYPRAESNGYVAEHIYVYQEYHKTCILPWAEVHHIEPVREGYCNNMPWNLMCVMKSFHRTLDRTKNLDNHICIICGSGTRKKPNGRPMWYYDKDRNPLCDGCYKKSKHVKKERKKKDWTGTICYLCGEDKTTGLTRHGSPNWRHLNNDPKKPICMKCYKKEYRKNK